MVRGICDALPEWASQLVTTCVKSGTAAFFSRVDALDSCKPEGIASVKSPYPAGRSLRPFLPPSHREQSHARFKEP